MERRTVKVGVTGKFGTRYGAKLRKQVKAIEILQKTDYVCPFCGKNSIKRYAVGIWRCKACRRNIAGGAWEFSTSAAQTAKTTINRLKKEVTDVKKNAEDEFADEERTEKTGKKANAKKDTVGNKNKDDRPSKKTTKK